MEELPTMKPENRQFRPQIHLFSRWSGGKIIPVYFGRGNRPIIGQNSHFEPVIQITS